MTNTSPLVQSRRIGRYAVHAIQAGYQALDGGAMFGVVPKTLWQRRIPADERNRITLGMRCLAIEHDDGLVLIDTGAGNKEDAKFKDIYGMVNEAPEPDADGARRTMLEAGLKEIGRTPADVRWVINTHLHFDHAGGNTYIDGAGTLRPSFPNARYVVQAGEHHWATHTNERTAASYFGKNWDPIIAEGRFDFIEGDREIIPGISSLRTPGHTPHHQSILIDGGEGIACFLGDICPTSAHLPLPWIMGYDVEPLVSLETKRWLLRRAEAEQWLLIYEHDATTAWSRVRHDGKSYGAEPA